MIRYPRYSEYKGSGVDWLGEIPAHWETIQLKYGYEVQLGKMLTPDSSTSSDTLESYLRAANVHWEGIDVSDVKKMWFSPYEKTQYRLAVGDLIVCEGGDVGRSAIWKGELPECYIQNAVHRLRGKGGYLNRFLYYWLFMLKRTGYIDLICSKATIAHLTSEKLSELPVFAPPFHEQHSITVYLDRETTHINDAIAEYRRLIELLQEKRATLISHAVTQGLAPDVLPKDSGVAWLGEIPNHWKVLQLRRIVDFIDYRGKTPEKVDSGVPLITARNIRNGLLDFSESQEFIREEDYEDWMVRGLPEVGDVLLTTEAPLGSTAQIEDVRVALAQRIILFKVKNEMAINEYLKYHFLSGFGQAELWSHATGSTAEGIKASRLRETLVAIPPLPEQHAIAAHLDHETTKIDATITEIETAIAHLEEYRTVLISAAVTGKIDVRAGASDQPDDNPAVSPST